MTIGFRWRDDRLELGLRSEFDDDWISMDDRLGQGRRASQSCSARLGVFQLLSVLMRKIGRRLDFTKINARWRNALVRNFDCDFVDS